MLFFCTGVCAVSTNDGPSVYLHLLMRLDQMGLAEILSGCSFRRWR
jgi:hypothetical protein